MNGYRRHQRAPAVDDVDMCRGHFVERRPIYEWPAMNGSQWPYLASRIPLNEMLVTA
jgi:hypothetical protein